MDDEQVQEAVADEAAVESTPQEIFAEKLQELREQHTPAEPEKVETDADADEVAEVEAEAPAEVAPVKVEGPSVAMKAFAKQQGLTDKVIALAQSDEQLHELLEDAAAKYREAEPVKEPEKAPELEILLPEDEFPADDPMRKQVVAMKEFYDGKLNEIYDYLGLMAKTVVDFEKAREDTEISQLSNEQGAFDKHFDSYEHPVLGSRATGLDEDQQEVRQAVYEKYHRLKKDNPKASDEALYERAASTWGYKPTSQKRVDAIKEASNGRLGGGQSRALPEPTLSGRALAESKMQEILSRK